MKVAVYCFDTSALVKRHVNETGTAWVRSLTQPKAAHTIFLARITAVEVFAAITRRQRGGSISPPQAAAILGHFRRQFNQRYNIIEMTPTLLSEAMLLARKHGLRAYDAVQLATMQDVDRLYQAAGIGPVTLISADGDLNAAAIAEGFTVDNPTTHP